MTYCETYQDEPVLIILTDAAITGNVINHQMLEKQGLLDPEDEGNTILWNIGVNLSSDTV